MTCHPTPRPTLRFALAALLTTGPLFAQAPQVPCTTTFTTAYCDELNTFYTLTRQLASLPEADPAQTALQNRQRVALQNLASPTNHPAPFLQLAAPTLQHQVDSLQAHLLPSLLQAAQSWDQGRLDRTGGVFTSSAVSTDLVARGGVAEFLAAAISNGPVSQTAAGNTLSFHANAGGLQHYLATGSALEQLTDPSHDHAHASLHNLDVSTGFDLNIPGVSSIVVAGAASAGTPVALASILVPSSNARFSGVSARYAISAPFDPNNSKFQQAWRDAVDADLDKLQKAAAAAAATLDNTNFTFTDADAALANASGQLFTADAQAAAPAALAQHFDSYCAALLAQLRAEHPQFNAATAAALFAVDAYQRVNRQVLDKARNANGVPLLLEYTYHRAASRPPTHGGRLVLSTKRGQTLYTTNLAATVYSGSLPAGAAYHRFRDVQTSLQVDRGLGKHNAAILSAAFYYQYQQDPTVLDITDANLAPGTNISLPANAQVLLGTGGSTLIGQLKATVNLHSGFKIPIAFKWASKSDLLDSTEKVGQFGITYDFSSFAGLLRAKPSP